MFLYAQLHETLNNIGISNKHMISFIKRQSILKANTLSSLESHIRKQLRSDVNQIMVEAKLFLKE